MHLLLRIAWRKECSLSYLKEGYWQTQSCTQVIYRGLNNKYERNISNTILTNKHKTTEPSSSQPTHLTNKPPNPVNFLLAPYPLLLNHPLRPCHIIYSPIPRHCYWYQFTSMSTFNYLVLC